MIFISDIAQHWEYITEFTDAFEPIYICSKRVQAVDCGLSDMYCFWMRAVFTLKELPNKNRFKTPLLDAMEKRERALTNNMAFKNAMFMDPRFNYAGSTYFKPDESDSAVVYF